MERIRIRMLNETAAIKESEDKRKQREGKKFGKQVQIEKLKEREKSKKDMEEKIKGLKRSTFLATYLPSFGRNIDVCLRAKGHVERRRRQCSRRRWLRRRSRGRHR